MIGCAIGTFEGLMPGAGGTIASFIAYNEARRWSKAPEKFGKGSQEGVAAPETANNTVASTALIPLLGFGIPGSNSTAVLLGGFLIHGLVPGPLLFGRTRRSSSASMPGSFVADIAQIVIGIVMLPALHLAGEPAAALSRGLHLALIMSGVYSIHTVALRSRHRAAAGLLGYFMRDCGFPFLPAVLGVVLGYLVESNYRRSLVLSGGDHTIFLEDRSRSASSFSRSLIVTALAGAANGAAQRRRGRTNRVTHCRRSRSTSPSRRCAEHLPASDARRPSQRLLLDVAGLCVAARDRLCAAPRVRAPPRPASHRDRPRRRVRSLRAALVNGTAAHGEDYDDTFEGGPVHAGAVIVPAVLAVAEQRATARRRRRAKGIAVGTSS